MSHTACISDLPPFNSEEYPIKLRLTTVVVRGSSANTVVKLSSMARPSGSTKGAEGLEQSDDRTKL
jgi:hypothetical protein